MSKKGLALTLATLMIWAVAVPAFGAAEPFPDVPQDHWAYEAIEMLRQAGLVEGYPDGTFGGERTFTRYEMAMVFSRILERLVAWLEGREALLISPAMGSTITALGREFAPELALLDVRVGELERLLGDVTVRTQSLQEQVDALVSAAAAAQEAAEAAAEAASRADDRAYRARLAAEQARAQVGEAAAVANRALAIAGLSDGLEGLDDEAALAGDAAQAARMAAERARRLAGGAEDAAMAQADAETANDRAYRARLAAQQAQALANEAREIAERGLAIAEMAYESANAKQAAEAAQQAADRAYRARLAAEDARAQARDAREVAERALAIAEMAGPGAFEEAVAAQAAVEEARLAAQRAQRLAADAESAAMIADAKADLARQEAADSMTVAREAYNLASDAMNEALRQGELARAEAREAVDTARQAERLAYLAHLSAERALSRVDEVVDDVAELKARPVFGGEVRADFEETHSSDKDALLDPRGDEDGPTIGDNNSVFATSVALNATVQPAEDVVVTGGLKLSAPVFGSKAGSFDLADLYVSVTTPGTVRSAYFGSVTGDQLAEGFSKYVLDPDRYKDRVSAGNRGGAVIETQFGSLSARFIGSRTNAPNPNIYGVASTVPLAEGLNLGFNYLFSGPESGSGAFRAFGETAGLEYDWTYALFGEDVAIDGKLGTTIGSIDLGFDYYSVADSFGVDPASFGKELKKKDDDIEAGDTAYKLTARMPLGIAMAVYERGRYADLANTEFTNHQLVGLEDVDLLGFDLAGYFYTDERQSDKTTRANRFDVSRTLQLGVPLTFSFTQAAADIDKWNDPGDPQWTQRSHQAIGVSLDEYGLTETLTLSAGYKQEKNPLDGDWTDPTEWVLALEDDNLDPFEVEQRNTLSTSISLAATDALTLSGGYKLERHKTDKGDVTLGTTNFGADYTLSMYGADITFGYGYESVSADGMTRGGDPKSTYSVAVTRDVWGATMDASYKLVTGRGSDRLGKKSARDMTAAIDLTYPIADGMDFTLSGKWGSSIGNDNTVDIDLYDDYYYASVKAGVGLKF